MHQTGTAAPPTSPASAHNPQKDATQKACNTNTSHILTAN
jgi:hypothetical protein